MENLPPVYNMLSKGSLSPRDIKSAYVKYFVFRIVEWQFAGAGGEVKRGVDVQRVRSFTFEDEKTADLF